MEAMTPPEAAKAVTYDPAHAELVLRDADAAYGACRRAGNANADRVLREWHKSPEWWTPAK